MHIIVLIVLGVALLAIIVFLVKAHITKKRIVNEFRRCNVIVYGKKGTGKDLLFQEVIHKRRAPYMSNISYGGQYKRVWANEISVAPNIYADFITDKVKIIEKKFPEDLDFYLSDGGIILPSQYDAQLHKTFPSLPIFYALSRHINNGNVHINTQNLGRVWKALREQADYYIRCRRVIKLPFVFLISVVEYDKYESAESNLLEMREGFANKFRVAEAKQFAATNGFVREGWVIVPKKHVKYDTRAYHEILFGCKAPGKKRKRPRREMPKESDGATSEEVVASQLSASPNATDLEQSGNP